MARTDRIEPDAEIVAKLASTALALPETYEEDAWTGVRWRIRARTFAHVMVAQAGFESSFPRHHRCDRTDDGVDLPRRR